METRQADHHQIGLNKEPVILEVSELSRGKCFTHWFISETLPESQEHSSDTIREPEGHKLKTTIREATDPITGTIFTPLPDPNHATNVQQSDYESEMLPIMDALQKLDDRKDHQYIVKIGWEGIARRIRKDL